MVADCGMTIKEVRSARTGSGICKNLSGNGVLFLSDRDFPLGTELEVNITFDKAIVPPLEMTVEVVRVKKVDGGFEVAGATKFAESP